MSFSAFQNDTGILKRYTFSGGDFKAAESIPVECDVQLQNKRIVSREGEEITTSAVVFVTPNPALLAKTMEELTANRWRFEYEGSEWEVEVIHRVRKPARDEIDHYELRLR